MPLVKIGHLNISVKGVSSAEIRSGLNSLGQTILQQIAGRKELLNANQGSLHINKLDLGIIRLEKNRTNTSWQQQSAMRIVQSIYSQARKEKTKKQDIP